MTAADLTYQALRRCGKIRTGTGPSPEEIQDGLDDLNNLVGQWRTRGLFVYTIRSDRYTITPLNQEFYTIGPSGADFTAQRPLGPAPGYGIINANIILTGDDPEVRLPVYIMDDDQWAEIRVPDIQSSIPIALYNDGSNPNSRLYLWPRPSQGNDLELFTRQQLDTWAQAETDVDFPPGYADAFQWTLAERFLVLFPNDHTPIVSAMTMEQARKARAAVQSLNSASPLLRNDAAFTSGPQRPYFNWKNGNLS